MHKIAKLGYISLGVPDLDDAVAYYSRFVRLDLTERLPGIAFMTGGIEHHWLRLEEGPDRGVKRIGYEVTDEAALEEIRARLDEHGTPYEEGGDFRQERVERHLRFADPGGFNIEVFTGMADRAVPPPGNGVAIEKFLHAGLHVKDWDATVAFYRDVLGFMPSDWIGRMGAFLRCGDRYHHSLVLIRSPQNQPRFDHFCVQVESIDDVMRFRHNAVNNGVALRDDVLRHGPSGSIGVYIKDETTGIAVEYCTGHPRIDEETHKPRVLPPTLEAGDVWRAPLPIPVIAPPTPAMDHMMPPGGAAPRIPGGDDEAASPQPHERDGLAALSQGGRQ